jgi:hypothetical protein
MNSKLKVLIITVAALTLVLGVLTAGSSVLPRAVAAAPAQPAASTPGPSGRAPTIWSLHVYFHDAVERDRLATQLGAEEVATTGGYLTVWADRALLAQIQALGLKYEINQQETALLNDPHLFGDSFYNGYKTVEEMQTFLDQEVAAHPTLAQKVDIGDSWCKVHPGVCTRPAAYNGYDLWALHITNQAIPGPKPVFWYEAGIHAREIATPEIAMLYIQRLLDQYDTNPDSHWLVDWHDIWVVPMVNPDGHHIVEAGGGGSSPYYQRKNANNSNGCTTWPPTSSTQFGTDNNRNFPFLWACCGGSSSVACSQTYRGPSAGSDPETQAVVNQIRALIPDQRGPNNTDPAPLTASGVYQDMHSNAALDLYPWGWTTTAAPNGPELANLGKHLAATNAAPAGNGYTACAPPVCLYAVDGDAVDQVYGDLGAAAFSTEVGGSDFLVSLSYVQNTLWPANQGSLVYQAKIARTPYLLAHGPDTRGVTMSPATVAQGTAATLNATINFAWTGNGFSQSVGAAEYYIDTPPWAGGTAIPLNGTFTAATVAVNATVDTSSLAVGRHILFVRGRGAAAYGGFPTWGPVTAIFLTVTEAGGPTATPTGTPTGTPTATPTRTPTNTPTPSPDFTLSVTPASRTVARPGSTTYTVALTSLDSFAGTVSLSVSGLPSRTSAGFSPNPVPLAAGGTGTSMLTVTVNRNAALGTSTLTVIGTGSGKSHSQTINLTITR